MDRLQFSPFLFFSRTFGCVPVPALLDQNKTVCGAARLLRSFYRGV